MLPYDFMEPEFLTYDLLTFAHQIANLRLQPQNLLNLRLSTRYNYTNTMSRNNNQTGADEEETFDLSMLISWDDHHYQWTPETANNFEKWHKTTPFARQFRSMDATSFTTTTTAVTASTSRSAVFSDSQEFESNLLRSPPRPNLVGPNKARLPVWGQKRKTADIWSKFEQGARKDTGGPKVFCKRCRLSMGHGSAGSSGTSTMKTHLSSARCKAAVPNVDFAAGGSQPQQQRLTNMPGIVSHVRTRVDFGCLIFCIHSNAKPMASVW